MSASHDVTLSGAAKQDVKEIDDYIAAMDGEDQADQIFERLDQAFHSLSTMPQRGNHPPEFAEMGEFNYREIHVRPFRIIYEIEGRAVHIVAVIDSRRDVQQLLRDRLVR